MKSFDEVVDSEFLKKYSDKIKGCYALIDKQGRLDLENLRTLFYALKGEENPYRFTYAAIHGMQDLMSTWDVPPKFRGQEERIYKMCLDKDTTWEELLGQKFDENVLL